MDRTAWIVVALCVVGLVVWEVYLAKQMAPRRALVATPGQTSPTPPPAPLAPSPSPLATPEAAPTQSAESAPTFSEKFETLRNSDFELRFTNRGGGISEATDLH